MRARHVVAFGAHALQAAFSGAFFLALVQKVYLEGVALDRERVGEMLSCSPYLGRHTPVVIMRRAVPRDSDVHRLIIEELNSPSALARNSETMPRLWRPWFPQVQAGGLWRDAVILLSARLPVQGSTH